MSICIPLFFMQRSKGHIINEVIVFVVTGKYEKLNIIFLPTDKNGSCSRFINISQINRQNSMTDFCYRQRVELYIVPCHPYST